MKCKTILGLLLAVMILQGCGHSKSASEWDMGNANLNGISIKGTYFVDAFGRQVIFSGVNKVNKDPNMNYTDNDSAVNYGEFRSWGFNCIRLGVIWDGVEPQPGKYDEKYLDKLEERVKWAANNGIYVMLDMHQDLFGVSFGKGNTALGDGAPSWATLTDNQPHQTGAIWSDSYFISPAVQKAFDNFWANTPVSDSMGVQDHYARMWQHVAKRFAGYKAVIGYDIMNEPFNGTQGIYILPVILKEYARLYAEETGKILSEQEVMNIWSDEDKRMEALDRMKVAEKYARVIDAGTELSQQFEKTSLQAMYQRVGSAIREVDTSHILFLEHAYFGNTGISSAIEPIRDRNGKVDRLVAYAAHGYDLLTDTKKVDAQSNDRVGLIFSRVNETSKRMNVPVLVGEWGAFGGSSDSYTAPVRFILGLFEKYQFSNTFWAYYNGLTKSPFFFQALVRPYPPFVSGKLLNYSFDQDSGAFSCTWIEDPQVQAPTVIYIPCLDWLVKESIAIRPDDRNTVIQPIEGSKAGYLIISPSGKQVQRSLSLKLDRSLGQAIAIQK